MPKLYTVKALAELFDKDEDTIRNWCREGDVFPHAFKVKDGWYVPAGDVKRLMRAEQAEAVDPRPAGRASSKGFVRGW